MNSKLCVSYFFYISGIISIILFVLMKMDLQSKNIEKDYIFRHHFSFWSEYLEMIKLERNSQKKRKLKIIFNGFNISIIILFFSFLLYW